MAPPLYPILFLLVFLLNHPPPASCSCTASDRLLIAKAFRHVSGFRLLSPNATAAPGGGCSLVLPSRNLTGTISWAYLRNVSSLRTIDLSGNALDGSVPGGFWSAPTLLDVNFADNRFGGALRFGHSPTIIRSLNLSGNRFSSAAGLHAMPGLEVLDLSRNSLVVVPLGLAKLRNLKHLDLSRNNMSGVFPDEFPLFGEGFDYLNVSCNKLTGVVQPEVEKKFGMSAFIEPGSLKFLPSASTGRRSAASSPTPPPPTSHEKKHRRSRVRKLAFFIAGIISAVVVVFASVSCVVCAVIKRRKKNDGKKCEKMETAVPQEVRWVAEAMQSAPVVLFEKPLMELMFADLAKATSGFGKESQLAEGRRRGPAFRAVLPGDMHLVARVEESAGDAEERSAAYYFSEIARLRHPNLLPLLGYCIPGKQKIALYEYMERGDLHRWLHELPAGQPNVEDWSGDTWEQPVVEDKRGAVTAAAPSAEVCDWPTRHRIALGVARGLAFLHQGWVGNARGVAHGHVVPSNILLGDDLEPRVADYGGGGVYQGTAEGDVYDFGVVVMELVTGKDGWSEEAVSWARGLVRGGRAAEAVDPHLRLASPKEEKEVVECFRVGYLCTAPNPEKRPTMQQVVGLLKDSEASVVEGNEPVTGHIISTAFGGKNGESKQTISYMAERVVGSGGSFGIVFQAKCLETGETVAIKKVLQDRRYKNRELQLMRSMDHSNVIALKHCFLSTTNKDELFLNLVMEFFPETIYHVLKHYSNVNQRMPLVHVKLYMYQIFRGLSYIHNILRICHRDVKPQNLLVDPLTHQVKLCDFGSAKVLIKGEPNISYICLRYYRAPELIFGAIEYTTSIDIWSAGCVLAELLLGQPLFLGESAVDQLVEIIKVLSTPTREEIRCMNPNYTEFRFPQIKAHPWHKVFHKQIPPEAIDLASRLLQYSPKLRCTALEACIHPFFDELREHNARLPNGRPFPPLFNFSKQELLCASPELINKLVPEHARRQCGVSAA
ncbi:LOW QUALITY PROTEIN: uncharacterized protein LOC141848492 [Curcuma longa]|uniref:LOW QUALITY PROTEIN: uncharacterized protein LOC141848492 n=1 Tax=Curcuma longa TaxID=136217 RepID=UPI003D9EF001